MDGLEALRSEPSQGVNAIGGWPGWAREMMVRPSGMGRNSESPRRRSASRRRASSNESVSAPRSWAPQPRECPGTGAHDGIEDTPMLTDQNGRVGSDRARGIDLSIDADGHSERL